MTTPQTTVQPLTPVLNGLNLLGDDAAGASCCGGSACGITEG
ncbi:hypothetical protein [Microbacterium gorillae]